MDAPPDTRTAIWLEYAWAVVTANAATTELLAGDDGGAPVEPVHDADDPLADDPLADDPLADDDALAELEELAEEAVGDLPATAGWFGPGWQPGGVLCLEEAEDASGALAPERWAALADATARWRHAGRTGATDHRWRQDTEATYRDAAADDTWDAGWFARFWELAGIDLDATAVAVVGHGRAGVLDASALAGALRPNLVLTTSERIGDAVRDAVPGLPVIAVDPEHGTTSEGRTLTFNEWALAASTLLR